MKLHKLEKLQRQRRFVAGRFIVGIDPAKAKHEAQILDPEGLPVGSSFSFRTNEAAFVCGFGDSFGGVCPHR